MKDTMIFDVRLDGGGRAITFNRNNGERRFLNPSINSINRIDRALKAHCGYQGKLKIKTGIMHIWMY